MQAAHRVVKNTGILYLKMFITFPASLYTTRLLLESLGVNDYGLFFLIAGTISIFMFLNSGMASAVQRFLSFEHGRSNLHNQVSIFNLAIRFHLIIAITVTVLFELIGPYIIYDFLTISENNKDTAMTLYQLAVINVFFIIISIPYDGIINANENMALVAKLSIFEAIAKLLIATLLVNFTFDFGILIFGLSIAGISIIIFLYKVYYCHKKYTECKLTRTYNTAPAKEMLTFAGWSLLGNASLMVSFYGQGIILNLFYGTVANAAHAIAGQINGQLNSLADTMIKAATPLIVKSEGSGDRGIMIQTATFSSKVGTILVLMLYIPFLIKIEYILDLWLKNIPEFTVTFCTWWLLKAIIDQVFLPLIKTIEATGDIKTYQIITSLMAISALVISYYLLSTGHEAHTLYIIYFCYALLIGLVTTLFSSIKCDLNISSFFKNVVIRLTTIFALSYFFIYELTLLLSESLFSLLLLFCFSSFLVISLGWYIGFNKYEKSLIAKYLKLFYLSKVNKEY
jgi:Na+-driven multidrug efflux pump